MFITIPKVFASMGFGNVCRNPVFPASSLCGAHKLHCPDRECSFHLPGRAWLEPKKSRPHRRRDHDSFWELFPVWATARWLECRSSKMQFLDFFDFLTNSVMMPIAAIATCLLISRVVGTKKIEEEVLLEDGTFRRKRIFNFMIRYLCPIFAAIILISSVANAFGWISM